MAELQNLSDIQPEIAFAECDSYKNTNIIFKHTELGQIKTFLPLREMAVSFWSHGILRSVVSKKQESAL